MSKLDYILSGERKSVIATQAKELIAGAMPIKDAIDMMDDLVESKLYFFDFLGEDSFEFNLSKVVLSIVRMMERSIRIQSEEDDISVKEWVARMPLRIEYMRRIKDLNVVSGG